MCTARIPAGLSRSGLCPLNFVEKQSKRWGHYKGQRSCRLSGRIWEDTCTTTIRPSFGSTDRGLLNATRTPGSTPARCSIPHAWERSEPAVLGPRPSEGKGGGGGGRRGHSLDSEVGGISPQDVETALAGNQIDGKRVLTVQIGDFMSDRDSVRGSGKTSARGSGKTSVGGSSKSGGVTPKPQDILSPRLRIKLPTTDGHGNITAPASITESPPLASSSRRSTHWGPPGPRKSNLSASPPMSNIWSSQTEIQQENHESISSAEVEMREAGWESGRRPSASVLAMDELEALAREVDAELSHNTPGLFRTPRASASEREIEGLERGSQEHALGVGGWSWAELAGGLSGGRASGSFSSRGGSHADTPPTSRQSSDPRM